MSIGYNVLNLPNSISKSSESISYIYSASGEKLAKRMKDNSYQYYAGNMVYKNDKTLNYLLFEEGLVNKVSGGYTYEYHLKDHLGNTRVTFQPNGSSTTTTQVAEYYPFGSSYSPINPAGTNKYLYNGKEKQDDMLSGTALDEYDYGARFYDPTIGRWESTDPKADKYFNISPFAYVANNPLKFIDPNGKDIKLYNITNIDNNGNSVAVSGLSTVTEKAMRDIISTEEGRSFFAQFAKAGDVVGGYEFTKDGALSDVTLNLWDYSYEQGKIPSYAAPGTGSYSVSDDKKTVAVKVVSAGSDKTEVGETLTHETQIHGYKAKDQINGKNVTSEDQDHTALKNQDGNHKGYKQYRSVQKQLQKNDKKYEKAFQEARERYDENYR
jgi:RHS repeat-associated protein